MAMSDAAPIASNEEIAALEVEFQAWRPKADEPLSEMCLLHDESLDIRVWVSEPKEAAITTSSHARSFTVHCFATCRQCNRPIEFATRVETLTAFERAFIDSGEGALSRAERSIRWAALMTFHRHTRLHWRLYDAIVARADETKRRGEATQNES